MSLLSKPGRLIAAAAALVAAAGLATTAVAWGAQGHRMIGITAVRALPDDVPAFVRKAAHDIGELSREPDRTKGSGKLHDEYREGNHFIDLDDEGRALGGPHIDSLPPTRQLYDDALRAKGETLTHAGWLPYSILDAYADLRTDFALWRIARVGEKKGKREHRAWFKRDRQRREALILSDIGELSHFIGDGSQPHHMSIHYNGWGDYPNPRGFTTERVHSPFESVFVPTYVRIEDVAADMTPLETCSVPVEACVAAYLKRTWTHIIPYYELEQAGGFRDGDPRGRVFAAQRLAAGSSMLRNLITQAWRESATAEVGWPKAKVADVEAQGLDAYDSLFGKD